MTGRKPTPTATLKLRGAYRPDRHGGRREPQFAPASVKPPAHLDRAAKTEWRRLAPHLAKFGLLSVADRAMFAAYCSSWSKWVTAESQLRESGGEVITGINGGPVANPWARMARNAQQELRSVCVEFGFTPSSRRNVQEHADDGDPAAAVISAIQSRNRGTG